MCAPSGRRSAPRTSSNRSPHAPTITPSNPPTNGQHDRFHHHLRHHMPPARAHRLTDRHFFCPAARANQKQIHQVHRADEQEEKHAALHQPKCRTDGAHVIAHGAKPPVSGSQPRPSFSLPGCPSRPRHCARRSVIALRRSWRPVSAARSCACRRRRNGADSARAAQASSLSACNSRASEERKRKSGGNTPTIVLWMPFTRMSRPRMFGSASRRWRQ